MPMVLHKLGMAVLKIGTIDDLAPRYWSEVEQFTRTRVAWLDALRDATGEDGNYFYYALMGWGSRVRG